MQPTSVAKTTLDVEEILSMFQESGLLSKNIKGFEARKQQQQMVQDIVTAYEEEALALIEAGTGTGKSMAYLLPAILWALATDQVTVISTNTINLQEQLIKKDIPMLLKALNAKVKAVLVKGMGNYLCLRKLVDAKEEASLLSLADQEQLEEVTAWSEETRDGTRSSLPLALRSSLWEKVNCEAESCSGKSCPFSEECFFFKARNRAHSAKILVVNHHLFFTDLAKRIEEDDFKSHLVLPAYDRLVLDEAHNIEDVATEYFAQKASQSAIFRLLGKLSTESQMGGVGKLYRLKQKILKAYPKEVDCQVQELLNHIDIDLSAERRALYDHVKEAFQKISDFCYLQEGRRRGGGELSSYKMRFRSDDFSRPFWVNEVVPKIEIMLQSIKRFVQSVFSLSREVGDLKNEKLKEKTADIFLDISALLSRLESMRAAIEEFIAAEKAQQVRWAEVANHRGEGNLYVVTAKLNISSILGNSLFKNISTAVLCSATISTNKTFSFVRKRLGIEESYIGQKRVIETIYDSPFDFGRQAMVVVPTDICAPHENHFLTSAAETIWHTVQVCRGNAFVLFTSFQMLHSCEEILKERLIAGGYPFFRQGEASRQILLDRFKETERSVLFGTDSFWEGVDVSGDALRCVIIAKLPFQVPTEPIIQARSEEIVASGGNAFMDYSVPTAIVKFKQGFGRLIRNKNDRGCIICLDSRLIKKSYGRYFLNSLPVCSRVMASTEKMTKEMAEFYRKTYYLVKNQQKKDGV